MKTGTPSTTTGETSSSAPSTSTPGSRGGGRTSDGSRSGSGGGRVEVCDTGHQAVAFLGSCPICRLVTREGQIKPLVEGKLTYRGELEAALQAHYLGVHLDVLGQAVETHLRRRELGGLDG